MYCKKQLVSKTLKRYKYIKNKKYMYIRKK